MHRDLTKLSPPLIIDRSRLISFPPGEGRAERADFAGDRRVAMLVSVYKLEGGGMTVLVRSSPGKGRAPILVEGVTLENIVEKVSPAVVELRGPKALRRGLLP